MRTLVIHFSHSGNNRLLASVLARRLGCDSLAVTEPKRRTLLTIFLDMAFGRRPRIAPLDIDWTAFDCVICVAPLWAAHVAHPMQTLLRQAAPSLRRYAFITLCGYHRPDQRAAIEAQLQALTGQPAIAVEELPVCELMPASQRDDVRAVSRHRATLPELAHFERAIEGFLKQVLQTAPPEPRPNPTL